MERKPSTENLRLLTGARREDDEAVVKRLLDVFGLNTTCESLDSFRDTFQHADAVPVDAHLAAEPNNGLRGSSFEARWLNQPLSRPGPSATRCEAPPTVGLPFTASEVPEQEEASPPARVGVARAAPQAATGRSTERITDGGGGLDDDDMDVVTLDEADGGGCAVQSQPGPSSTERLLFSHDGELSSLRSNVRFDNFCAVDDEAPVEPLPVASAEAVVLTAHNPNEPLGAKGPQRQRRSMIPANEVPFPAATTTAHLTQAEAAADESQGDPRVEAFALDDDHDYDAPVNVRGKTPRLGGHPGPIL